MRTGLFGGAFNPVHNGHMKVAYTAIEYMKLDRLILIPSGNAPHKAEGTVSRNDRYKMLEIAANGDKRIEISDYEIARKAVSYSADTVKHFAEKYPDDELFFLIGDDSYNQLSTWHKPQELLKYSTLLVFPREGGEILPPALKIPMNKVKISSSDVRAMLAKKKDCTKMLPKGVFEYIVANNLYI